MGQTYGSKAKGTNVIKLVLCDMDLTLIPFGETRVSAAGIAAFHRLMDVGVCVGAVSGRGLSDLILHFGSDAACLRTAVASNGCIVVANGEVVHTESLDRAAVENALAIVRTTPGVFMTVDKDGRHLVLGGTYDDVIRRFEPRPGRVFEVVDALPDGPLAKVNLVADGTPATAAKLPHVVERLHAAAPAIDYVILGAGGADMMPAGTSKATGVRILLDHLGLAEDEMLFFGDSHNDLPLFEAFANGVAVANATAEIRELARFHIGPCTEDACAMALADLAEAIAQGRDPAWMGEEACEAVLDRALRDPTISIEYLMAEHKRRRDAARLNRERPHE